MKNHSLLKSIFVDNFSFVDFYKLIAAQKQMEITYKYYQIALNNNVIETVDAYEDAQNIIDEIKQDEKNKDVDLIMRTLSGL